MRARDRPPLDDSVTGQAIVGRAEVRCALYMPTITAIRCNPVIHAFAERLKAAGKPAKVVIVACMRKLLSIMNAMLKSNAPWNPNIA